MRLSTFDVFDTALLRRSGGAQGVFLLLAARLFPADRALREDFLQWRLTAERQAVRRRGKGNCTLADIYDSPAISGFAPYGREELVRAELQMESDCLVVNPRVRTMIEQRRQKGEYIAFVSDMYLPSTFLVDVLRREGCMEEGERVYVSCEYEATKSSGRLYDIVRRELRPTSWHHYGDNRMSDFVMAHRRGIKAHLVRTPFTAAERLQMRQSNDSYEQLTMHTLVGLQREARLAMGNSDEAGLAADFVASTYVAYVAFLLREAHSRGIKRLYFLSRDSYILMKIAERFAVRYPDIELRYLFVSRKSLGIPMTGEKKQTRLANIVQRKTDVDGSILVDYFRQEKLLDGTHSAMVDVGWIGSSRHIINSLLTAMGVPPVEFFYLGVQEGVLPSASGIYTALFAERDLRKSMPEAIVETYFSASPWPSTMGYERRGDEIVPVFREGETYCETPLIRANVETAQRVADSVVRLGIEISDAVAWMWARRAVDAFVLQSVSMPLRPLTVCGDFDGIPFARRLSLTELVRSMKGEKVTVFGQASLCLTVGRRMAKVLWAVRWCLRTCPKIFHLSMRATA